MNKLAQLENIKTKHLARTIELKRQTQHTASSSAAAIAVNHVEQKDLLNSLFNSSSPKSIGYVSMDSNSPTTVPSPLSSLYNSPSSLSPSASFYSSGYQNQRNASPIYRPSSLQFDPGQASFHDSHARVKTPVFDEFLTPSPSSYVPVNNPSLSVHSYMNVSFQETANNSTTITPSSFNHQHHHSTTYPY
jgi:hypothetical protein